MSKANEWKRRLDETEAAFREACFELVDGQRVGEFVRASPKAFQGNTLYLHVEGSWGGFDLHPIHARVLAHWILDTFGDNV